MNSLRTECSIIVRVTPLLEYIDLLVKCLKRSQIPFQNASIIPES